MFLQASATRPSVKLPPSSKLRVATTRASCRARSPSWMPCPRSSSWTTSCATAPKTLNCMRKWDKNPLAWAAIIVIGGYIFVQGNQFESFVVVAFAVVVAKLVEIIGRLDKDKD